MMCGRALLVLLAASGTSSVLGTARDVPLGECHNCEVHCFQDCTERFHEEVIQGDRRDYELKQRMLKKNGGGSLSARGLAGVSLVEETNKKVGQFEQCLAEEKCPMHDVLSGAVKGCHASSLLATEGKKCASGNQTCAQNCAAKASATPESFVQAKSLRKSFPHAPVDRGAFEKGKTTLDFCFKGCLAVVCGCSGAPGFSKINKLFKQIKKNENHGEPVVDTPATPQYRAATAEECAKGMPGKKVNKGLFVPAAGNAEICTKEHIEAFYGAAYPEEKTVLKKCKSSALEDADMGCAMVDDVCVFKGFTPQMECKKQYFRDPTR